jgi:glycerophosphoryl diester phosphodiesterase
MGWAGEPLLSWAHVLGVARPLSLPDPMMFPPLTLLLGMSSFLPLGAPPAPRPLVLGHRGLSALHLENSMAAFRGALKAGLDGFELDVQLSRDGVCHVLHDEDLARTAQRPGLLRHLHSAHLPPMNNGEPLPRLSDVLELQGLVNVELKEKASWQAALAAVRAREALHRVIFSSFLLSEIFALQQACAEARCGLLWEAMEAERLDARDLDALLFWTRQRNRAP